MLNEFKTDIDILDAKIMGVDLAQEYPCTKCIHCKPCEEAYDMDLGDNYQYCPHYDDGKAHEKEIQEYQSFLYKIYNELYPSQLQVECIRAGIKKFLERMENKHDGT